MGISLIAIGVDQVISFLNESTTKKSFRSHLENASRGIPRSHPFSRCCFALVHYLLGNQFLAVPKLLPRIDEVSRTVRMRQHIPPHPLRATAGRYADFEIPHRLSGHTLRQSPSDTTLEITHRLNVIVDSAHFLLPLTKNEEPGRPDLPRQMYRQ